MGEGELGGEGTGGEPTGSPSALLSILFLLRTICIFPKQGMLFFSDKVHAFNYSGGIKHVYFARSLFQLSNMPYGISQSHKSWCSFPCVINVMAGQSGGPEKLDIDGIVSQLRKLSDSFPQPVKSFPWTKVMINFCLLVVELAWAVAKYLCVPLLAITPLSEMSYCAHERKMVLVPIPLLAGSAIAGILQDTATELSPDLKKEDFQVICF